MRYRRYADEQPVAMSVLACCYDQELGEWTFSVLDPGDRVEPHTHWIPLGELTPDMPLMSADVLVYDWFYYVPKSFGPPARLWAGTPEKVKELANQGIKCMAVYTIQKPGDPEPII